MKRMGVDRRVLAVAAAAFAAMALWFSLGRAAARPLGRLPCEPPGLAQAAGEGQVDINTAGREALMSLPGIGQVRAQAIIDDRESNGPYRYPEDLIRVKGIGEGILSGILDQITTGGNANAQNSGG